MAKNILIYYRNFAIRVDQQAESRPFGTISRKIPGFFTVRPRCRAWAALRTGAVCRAQGGASSGHRLLSGDRLSAFRSSVPAYRSRPPPLLRFHLRFQLRLAQARPSSLLSPPILPFCLLFRGALPHPLPPHSTCFFLDGQGTPSLALYSLPFCL